MSDVKEAVSVVPVDISKNGDSCKKKESVKFRNIMTQHSPVTNIENILVSKKDHVQNGDSNVILDEQAIWIDGINQTTSAIQDVAEAVNTTEPPAEATSNTNETKRKAPEKINKNPPKKKRIGTQILSKLRPGFDENRYNETSYYFENGLRKVYPYYFTFTTFTKGRWIGEKVIDVFSREFRAHPQEEYERAIISGSLTVNHEKVPVDYKLHHNDLMSNTVHRHEVPVVQQPIEIIHLDDDICVVNKPASIPVHPCGRYRHNTVVFIMAKEYNLRELKPIHRLDRLTSGLLLLGRNSKKAREMETHISSRQVQKEYVCRTEGKFPE